MIKALIFDLDGVLIDAKEWHYEALNRALGLFGLKIHREDHLVTYDGLPTKKKLEMMTMEYGLPVELHPFINRMKQKFTIENIFLHCKPLFQHQYALFRFRREGLRLAVCSNSIRETLDLMLSKAGIIDLFEFTLSNQDVTKAKPDPEIYLRAMGELGLRPEECLILEDNFNGIKAAEASGGHLYKVDTVWDVDYWKISARIKELQQ